jgi:hypothetical protein
MYRMVGAHGVKNFEGMLRAREFSISDRLG